MFLTIAAVSFSVYVLNVVLGAADMATFLSDVGEMIVLLISSLFFVVAILKREGTQQSNADTDVS